MLKVGIFGALGSLFGTVQLKEKEPFFTKFGIAQLKANEFIEDRFCHDFIGTTCDMYAVFDGHGGWQLAEHARHNYFPMLREISKQSKDQKEALKQSFIKFDEAWKDKVLEGYKLGFGNMGRVGCCALVLSFSEDKLIVANAGDCRAVMGSKIDNQRKSTPLSTDHSANSASEQARLRKEHPGEKNIVVCKPSGACYVKGCLMPSRSFGDLYLKYPEFNALRAKCNKYEAKYAQDVQPNRGRSVRGKYTAPYITAEPEISEYDITNNDDFVIIASDGIWDELSNDEAVDYVYKRMANKETPEKIAENLKLFALEKSGWPQVVRQNPNMLNSKMRRSVHDDMTVFVVFFNKKNN
eukprot:TRINITY_DN774198_c0_g1_i1.p1 TRINITY_DN774198_c0_g1~~TRINITY_DN774198_c0_g1_i1.p1  ORF type:complete len:353 (-),score=98.43 TRINITY_DN774198_c0_g1_i1:74-1132(-)